MSGSHSTRTHSPLKLYLGRLETNIQLIAPCIKCTPWPSTMEVQDAPLTEALISMQKIQNPHIDNDSTNHSNATVTLGGPEAEGHPKDPVYSTHNKLMALMREINNLHQWIEAGEGQSAEILDCIECELPNLSIVLHQPPSPTTTEPFVEVIWQYTNTLCTTQKQTNLTNSLLQDIVVFNKHNSTKLEEWLTDLETAADLTNESRAKLAKAKLRGLTCTLVTEAITLDKSWD